MPEAPHRGCLREHPEVLERFLDGRLFLGRARFHALSSLTVGSITQRQPVDFLAVSNPACLRHESILPLNPCLDLLVCGGALHEMTLRFPEAVFQWDGGSPGE